MSATYDLETPVGLTRFEIPDTSIAKPIFSDAEIQLLLKQNDDDPKLAAADALERIASDSERLVSFSRGGTSATRTSAEVLLARASALRAEVKGSITVGAVERDDFW